MNTNPPHFREASSLTLSSQRSHAAALPYRQRVNRHITIPAFSYPAEWLGAPYCIKKFDFSSGYSLSIPLRQTNPGVAFTPIIAWKLTGLAKQRYRLWDETVYQLYVDLYTQQTIPPFFSIEIWTVYLGDPCVNPSEIIIPVSKTEIPTDFTQTLGSKYADGVETADQTQQLV